MLYRQRQSTSIGTILILIIIGISIGVGFFFYDNVFKPSLNTVSTPTTIAFMATSPPTALPTAEPTLTPTPNFNAPSHEAVLFIPSAGIHSPIITTIIRGNTWDVTNLGTNVGYLQGTAWIGQPGNIVLSGHVEMADGRKGVFASLREVSAGEQIVLAERGEEHRYTIRELKEVAPDDLSVVYPTDTDTLTLITCADYNFVSNEYETRFVVVAERVS